MTTQKVVFWDWNGTLLDDISLIHRAVCSIFVAYDKPPPSFAEYARGFRGDYLSFYWDRGIDAPRDELNRIFVAYYCAHCESAPLMECAGEVLEELRLIGVRMYLITGQLQYLVDPFFKRFDVERYFHESHYHVLDKESCVRNIVKRDGLDPRACYLVGDMPADVEHAQRAGIRQVAFLRHTPVSSDILDAIEPDHAIKCLSELPVILRTA